MAELITVSVDCPYCGECIELLIDDSEPEQRYIEDCSVCCRPMIVTVVVDADAAQVSVCSEDE